MHKAASAASLQGFFAPASAAIVGASEDLAKFGGRLCKAVFGFGYGRPVYPVNPSRAEIFGAKCYPSISALPETPEHVGIIVPAGKVIAVLEECAARGTRYATVFTGGFAETGTETGIRLQQEVRAFAQRANMRIMGPNCNGFVNFVDGFAMTNTAAIRDGPRPAGNVGVVTHSGGLGQINVMWRAQEAGVGISYQVSCGNEADLDAIDFAQFMVEGEATDVVMMALETIRSGPRFIALARAAAERAKPLVVLKFGRTDAGQKAASSHTGAMTGADDVYNAVFRQYGVIRVTDCNELYELAKILRTRRVPAGPRLAALTGSGGHAVLLADLGASVGLEWSTLSEKTVHELQQLMPAFAGVSNPIDLTSAQTGAPKLFTDAMQLVARDPLVDALIPILVVPTIAATDAVVELHHSTEKPVAVLWTGFCPQDSNVTPATLVARGVPTYRDALTCVQALRASVDYGRFLARYRSRPSLQVMMRPDGASADRARAILALAPETVGENLSKEVLALYGLPVTREELARSAEEAASLAEAIGGSVALKIVSPDIPHKTEANAIRLGVSGAARVRAAYAEVMEAANAYKPGARIEGVLVQEMMLGGIELMLGVTRDPVFGPVVTVGRGGIHVEILDDVAHRIAPLSRPDASDMLSELKIRPLLEGVRGAAPADIAALVDAIERLSWLAYDLIDDVRELAVNPLVVRSDGVRVVDALIVKTNSTEYANA